MRRQSTNFSTDSERARRKHGQSIVFVRLNQSLSVVDNEELSHVSQGLLSLISHNMLEVLTENRVQRDFGIASTMENFSEDTTAEVWTSRRVYVQCASRQHCTIHVGEAIIWYSQEDTRVR